MLEAKKFPICLEEPVIVLAPMAGVTDFPFRQMVQKYGSPSFVISEMIASQSMVRAVKKTMRRQCQPQEKIGVQIVGNDPQIMAEATRISIDKGAQFIDINMGCPALQIAVNSYAGAALMKDEGLAQQIFEAVVKASCVPVSVKMRKGWNLSHQNAVHLCHVAYHSGISWISLHGRTRDQLFHGKADWDFIEEAAKTVPLPVIGNGDITTVTQAKEALSKVAGIMMGRGNYGRPWFLSQVRHFIKTGEMLPDPPREKQYHMVCEHFDALLTHYGHKEGLMISRKHLMWYSRGWQHATDFRKKICQATDVETVLDALKCFYYDDEEYASH